LYAAAVALAFVDQRISDVIYVFVALMWLVPDRRIESKLKE
jgi:TMEM175 potassium channel family protein